MRILTWVTRRRTASLAVAALASAAVVAATGPASVASSSAAQWAMFGQNTSNTASTSTTIGTGNVGALRPKWAFTTQGDVSARPAVANGVAYFPDWSGHLYAIKSSSGKLVWSKDIHTDYLPGVGSSEIVSRTSPYLDTSTNTLYVGTQTGAYLLAVDATSGALKWATQLDAHPLAIDTQSPVGLGGSIYVGVASLEEGAAANPSYPCCSFRGSVLKVDAATGHVVWKTYTVPQGYSGGSVWGSTIVPDPARGFIYATTGNNYSTPTAPEYTQCRAAGGTQESCLSPDDHIDSIVALRMSDGGYTWADRFASSDDWNVACFSAGYNCPVSAGPDFDFGSGAQLFTVQTANGPQQILGAGQKSGVYSAVDPGTGKLLWATQVGPGSALGGMEWGSATDGRQIYVGIGNTYGIPHLMSDGSTDTAGSWAALDPVDGHVVWQVADPDGGADLAPMAVANGVVYAASMGGSVSTTAPTMFALDARTGSTLWRFAAGSSVIAGATIANDTVYWGSGYSHFGLGSGNTKLYAFTLGGQ